MPSNNYEYNILVLFQRNLNTLKIYWGKKFLQWSAIVPFAGYLVSQISVKYKLNRPYTRNGRKDERAPEVVQLCQPLLEQPVLGPHILDILHLRPKFSRKDLYNVSGVRIQVVHRFTDDTKPENCLTSDTTIKLNSFLKSLLQSDRIQIPEYSFILIFGADQTIDIYWAPFFSCLWSS